MSSQLVAAMPCSPWSSRVASMIRRRVCAAAEALRAMSYFRGDISLTNFLRVSIVAGVVLPKSHSPRKEAPMSTQASIVPQSATARGQQYWFFGMLAEIKATAADTGGRYSLVEITAPAGLQAPLHVHYREDEGFYVLEGSVTIEVGEETVELGPGQHAYGPRDVPHRFTIGPDGARMIWVLVPGGFDEFVADVSAPAEAPTVPPPSVVPPENAAEIVLRHGMELLPE
jgi:mannose-6-phosphate isomerase-like protein (cupin superfamily)